MWSVYRVAASMPTSNSQDLAAAKAPRTSGWRRLVQVLLVFILLAGTYILFLQLLPRRAPLDESAQLEFLEQQPLSRQDRLIIPKIGVSAPIESGDWQVLERDAVWHRYPERGNPVEGGNTVLAAHRYVFGWTPQQVTKASVLYNINQLEIGDSVYVDYRGKRYAYKITSKSTVAADASEIEAKTDEPRLTIYSCTLKGERDGREVVVAEPIRL